MEAMTMPDHAGTERLGMDRLIFFSDAVFAIAITLLALDLNVPPNLEGIDDERLLRMLLALTDDIAAFVTSFCVIALFWIGHHAKFRSIARYDNTLLWLNMLLLMTIAFIPFPTRVMSDYYTSTSTIFYAAAIAIPGILTAVIDFYVVHKNRLADPGSMLHLYSQHRWLMLSTPIIFLISIPVAYFSPGWGRLVWLLLIPMAILKARMRSEG